MAKLPSFQFYPGDWKKDAGVQALSYEERGIWFELMLMMFESPERGKLVFRTGTPIPEDAIARALGLDKQKVNQILSKLLDYGVASKEEDTGVIYCRRMVRDAKLSKMRAECGKLGGNPNLLNQNSSKTEAKRKQNTTKPESKIQPLHLHLLSSDKKKEIDKEKSGFSLDDFLNAAKDPSVALPEQDAKECFDFYAAQDFLRSNGQRITSLVPLLRQWKRRRGEFAPQTRQQQGAPPQNKEVSVETFRRAYDWLHNLDRMDYIPERDKAILRANLDDLRGKFKNEYNDVCTRLKDPFDELTKYIKKTGGILYA